MCFDPGGFRVGFARRSQSRRSGRSSRAVTARAVRTSGTVTAPGRRG